jgi:hypothetical protein
MCVVGIIVLIAMFVGIYKIEKRERDSEEIWKKRDKNE